MPSITSRLLSAATTSPVCAGAGGIGHRAVESFQHSLRHDVAAWHRDVERTPPGYCTGLQQQRRSTVGGLPLTWQAADKDGRLEGGCAAQRGRQAAALADAVHDGVLQAVGGIAVRKPEKRGFDGTGRDTQQDIQRHSDTDDARRDIMPWKTFKHNSCICPRRPALLHAAQCTIRKGAHRKGEVALARLRQLLQEDRLHRHLQVLCIHVSIQNKHCNGSPTASCEVLRLLVCSDRVNCQPRMRCDVHDTRGLAMNNRLYCRAYGSQALWSLEAAVTSAVMLRCWRASTSGSTCRITRRCSVCCPMLRLQRQKNC